MHQAIQDMLDRYKCRVAGDYEHALREIFQELALLGLWRGKFFEHAVFYGGTALRILHGLQRFSEDMDFSLLEPNPAFDLAPYCRFVGQELEAWGFQVEVVVKEKAVATPIKSAFLKTTTLRQMLVVEAPRPVIESVPVNKRIKIKMEVDTDPPRGMRSETGYLLRPVPFPVRICTPEILFAGKMHAVLFRTWGNRAKGRDWYDLIWYIARDIPVDLAHLKARMCQTDHWMEEDPLDRPTLIGLLSDRIERLNIESTGREVEPFLKDSKELEVWSKVFFCDLITRLSVC